MRGSELSVVGRKIVDNGDSGAVEDVGGGNGWKTNVAVGDVIVVPPGGENGVGRGYGGAVTIGLGSWE